MTATDLVVWGIIVHLVIDWIFQNAWMNDNKANLRHPAGYVHALMHGLGMLLLFSPLTCLVLGVLHLLVDTRKPLMWWRRVYRQTESGPAFIPFAMWQDQVIHFACIAAAALFAAHI